MVYIVIVDVWNGIGIGILVFDWVIIMWLLVDLISVVDDFICFGYVVFLWVKDGGVLCWFGYIEVVVDLVWMVGL